jgi:ABC-2 type transport system permease protein
MRVVYVIARREVGALLHTATGWLVLAAFLLLAGVFWVALVDHYVSVGQDQVFDPYAVQQLSLADHLLAPWFGNLVIVVLVVAPALTMRLLADEVRHHTIELLRSSPITTAQIVLGKYLGSLAVYGLLLAASAALPCSLYAWASPDPGAVAAGYLALLGVGAVVLAVGLLASACTDSPLVALMLTFAVVLCLWIVGWTDPDPTSATSQLALSTHVQDLLRGALRLSDLSYFVLLVGWCLFATHQRVEAHRYL